SRRTIPLPGLVAAALEQHKVRQAKERADLGIPWDEAGFVFATGIGTALDPDNTTKLVKRALKTAGVRDVRMHDFRHGCVSVLLGLGVPPRTVMEIAGHSGLEMTMNVYAHVSLEDKQAAFEKLNALFEEA
ncbi:tyrosine-type recombinase/integrase, partial [Nocardioides sp.]|uniref:tyrosine-type recombinase/integrase n=1 Tax=Nocardioides sp. TaxID=35761 RepID=UPI00286E67AE